MGHLVQTLPADQVAAGLADAERTLVDQFQGAVQVAQIVVFPSQPIIGLFALGLVGTYVGHVVGVGGVAGAGRLIGDVGIFLQFAHVCEQLTPLAHDALPEVIQVPLGPLFPSCHYPSLWLGPRNVNAHINAV